ncbi:MAG: ATP-dependent Clp protease proteolytic subunit [Ruminococcus sp.]|nr:ATP-dependent Clp protease proteolytic subunit [Ruminococcus sp.]
MKTTMTDNKTTMNVESVMTKQIIDMMTSVIRQGPRGYQALYSPDVLFTNNRLIYIKGSVDSDLSEEIIQKLLILDLESHEKITIFIDSPGGVVDSGYAIFDVIRNVIQSPVTTVCTGIAASMAFIIYLAGDERLMLRHSRLMLHDPSMGGGNLAGVKPLELKTDILEKLFAVRQQIGETISERSGMPIDDVFVLTEKDTYLNAEESLEKGFATKIINSFEDITFPQTNEL